LKLLGFPDFGPRPIILFGNLLITKTELRRTNAIPTPYPLSCPHFCTCSTLEMYHTGYLWAPLHSSDFTHPSTSFSKTSLSSPNVPLSCSESTCLLAPQTPRTPTHHRLRTLVMAGLGFLQSTTPAFQTPSDYSELRLIQAISPSLRASTSSQLLVHVSLMLLGSGSVIWTLSMSSDMRSSYPLILPCFSFLWLSFQPTSIPSFIYLGSVAIDDSIYILDPVHPIYPDNAHPFHAHLYSQTHSLYQDFCLSPSSSPKLSHSSSTPSSPSLTSPTSLHSLGVRVYIISGYIVI